MPYRMTAEHAKIKWQHYYGRDLEFMRLMWDMALRSPWDWEKVQDQADRIAAEAS